MGSQPEPRAAGEVQSVHRALDLLESVGRRGQSGVSEVARENGLNTPTAHNLMKTLVRRGYLLSSGGRYRLGPAVSALTARFEPTIALPELVRPVIVEASKTLAMNVMAYVLTGDRLTCIGNSGAAEIPLETGVPPDEWASKSLLTPSGGRVLVAMTRSAETWPGFIASAIDVEPEWSNSDWLRHLDEITKIGICAKHTPGRYAAIGVPVWAGNNVVLAALGCSLASHQATPQLMQNIMHTLWIATTDLSSQLGCDQIPYNKPTLPDAFLTRIGTPK